MATFIYLFILQNAAVAGLHHTCVLDWKYDFKYQRDANNTGLNVSGSVGI
jgi:hypothetical protein